MNELDDTYYIQKTLDGNIEYFSRLIDRYSSKVYALVIPIVRCKEDAEELTQDIFLKTFKVLSGFKGECRFSTWLYRIAYNTAISATRKKKMEFLYVEEQTINNVMEEDMDEVFNESGNNLLLAKLEKAVAQLPPDERALLSLYYTEEQSMEEIAAITHLSISNVKVKLHRIRKKLYIIIQKMA